MAYKFQIGTFTTSGSIDVSSGDIDLNAGAVENDDLAGGITSDKMASFEDGAVLFGGSSTAFVSSETAKHNMDTEIAARSAADVVLQNNITSEEAARIAQDGVLQTNITAEETRALAAEAAIQADVDANELAASNDRTAIRSEFAAADTTLQNNIDAEAARIDALLSGSSVDLDTLIEIVNAYELADTDIISSITSLSGALDQEIIDRTADVDAEETARIAADGVLQANINALSTSVAADLASEEAARIAGDSALSSSLMVTINALQADVDQNEADADAAILAEETARIAADSALSTSITNLSSAVAADLASQNSDFTADINALQSEIDAEEVRAQAAEAALSADITALSGAVATDLAALQADVDQNEADADAAILAEETARISADTTLQNNINALSSAVATDLAAEEAARISADATLQSNIDVESARIDALLSGSSIDLDTLVEIVDAYELADTTIISTITALQADVDQNELDGDNDRALIRSEFAAADSALSSSLMVTINALQADVDQNELDGDNDRALIRTEFAAADTTLQNNIDAEETARIAADGVLQTNINNLSGAFAADLAAAEQQHADDYAVLFDTKSMSSNGNADKTVVFIDAASGNVSVAVPGGSMAGEFKRIKRKDASANSVTLTGDIEGVSSNSVSMFDNAALMLVWDGSMWWIM